MNRVMTWAAALLIVVSGLAVSQEATAGLFNRGNDCCQPAPCCKPARQGLFAKLKAKRAAKDCCCEAPAPCCEAPAPCCPAPAPTCCEAPAPCGCEAAPVADCGCSAAAPAPAPCGCEAAPACGGCKTANCDCLNKRQLRRANRKGECCGAKANTCSSCVQTASYEVAAPACGCEAAPAVEGCSTCGGGEVIIESAPAEAAGEEAAPEAPEAPKGDTTT